MSNYVNPYRGELSQPEPELTPPPANGVGPNGQPITRVFCFPGLLTQTGEFPKTKCSRKFKYR